MVLMLTHAVAAAAAAAAGSCASDLDCSLNGVCSDDKVCVCDAAWKGPACSTLDLQPTGPTGDLRLPNVSTWGMTVLPKGAGDQEWHGLYAEMTRGCGLTSWETNSQIAHATAPTPAGPWTRQDTVLGVWAHTPSAAVARDGTIVLFHLGSGVGGGALPGSREYNATCTTGRSPCGTHPQHHCNKTEPGRAAAAAAVEAPAPPPPPLYSRSTSPRAAARGTAASAAGTGTTTGTSTVSFHVSHNGAAGPWEKTTASITDSSGLVKGGLKGAAADNFAFDTPFAHPNGTLYVVTAGNAILRAEDWRGPYDVVIATGACGPGEDNYVWVDHRSVPCSLPFPNHSFVCHTSPILPGIFYPVASPTTSSYRLGAVRCTSKLLTRAMLVTSPPF